MKVIIGESLYETNRKGLRGILKTASKQIPFGIYAVEKDDICELRKRYVRQQRGIKESGCGIQEERF